VTQLAAREAPLHVSVSGSFKRHLETIQRDVELLRAQSAVVLSPSDPRIVDAFGEFVFVSSDLRRSIKGIQNRHLAAIRESDFLWLVCPDGYVGQSGAMEVGFAVANDVPIYSDVAPSDWTIRQYVTPIASVERACLVVRQDAHPKKLAERTLLVAPESALDLIRTELDVVERGLLHDRRYRAEDPIELPVRHIKELLAVPTTRR
jgi:hypothetical protein